MILWEYQPAGINSVPVTQCLRPTVTGVFLLMDTTIGQAKNANNKQTNKQ